MSKKSKVKDLKICQRIKQIREESKMNQGDFCGKLNIVQSTWSGYESNTVPNVESLKKICEFSNITYDWIIDGKEPKYRGEQIGDNITKIPFLDMRASAGGGAFNENEFLKEILVIKSEWVRSKLRPNHIFIMMVDGDSMVPTFDSGDMLLVSRSKELFHHNDGIYVFRRGDTISVKRFQFLSNQVIRIISDNKENYQPELLDLKTSPEGEFEIIGRVFIVVKRLFKTSPPG